MNESPPPAPDPRLQAGTARLAAHYDGTFSTETVRHLLHDSYRRLAEGAAVRTHLVVLAERLATERLDALARTTGPTAGAAPRVLFVCTGNAGRSQLAAAILAHLAKGTVQVSSAGTRPAADLDTHIADVLAEAGVPLPEGAFPKPLTEEVVAAADIVVTMGCGDTCPLPAGRRYLDWPVPDPDGAPIERVRAIRDQIGSRVQALIADLLPTRPK
ncbi:three-helix bundle dimerization domain-containing protein [Kitasatospora purpeofusca]|uniref:arsenate reductase/protein-tyrosine-phosphatase family protein n=1 Tax=Kitasatospora purpeofusca TaxID=67352 RepID=UPI002258F4E3|nr:arsenate reductase ArsC [Kitasatospora purpeofusca]MCX4758732.1 arsenate reductase ArsC [Kitasatospora purpeofusca]WSR30836.1 arsenate reductase ArsC [Kitasatospora purpeofusca]